MFFGAVLSPILLIILFNAVVSCIVTVISVKHARNRHKQRKLSLSLKNAKNKLSIPPGELCKLICSLTGVNVLLGLTWILSLFTLIGTGESVEAAFVVRFLFVFFNSFQGFFIFLFFVVLSADARTQWLQRLCPCLKIKDHSTKLSSRLSSSRLSVDSRKSSTSSLVPTRKNSASTSVHTRQDSITLQMGIITTTIIEEDEEDEPVVTAINEDALTVNNEEDHLTTETTSDVNPLITE